MISYVLWLCVITLVQLSLIYLWFDSTLFSPLLQWCLKRKKDTWYKWFVFTLLTCPQCLGYWFAWAVAGVCCLIPGAPTVGLGIGRATLLVFITGLAVAVLSRLIDGFMPEPVNQKLFVVTPEEEKSVDESISVDEQTTEEEVIQEDETNGD